MNRNYFLGGLITVIFLPALMSGHVTISKPTILISPIGIGDMVEFESFMKEVAEPNFIVKEKNFGEITPGDLKNVAYILIYGWLNENELKKISSKLPGIIKAFNNKGLIIFNQPGFAPLAIDEGLEQLFNGNIFQLNMRFGVKGVEFIQNTKSEEFKKDFQEKLQILLTTINQQLLQRLDRIASDLQHLNQELSNHELGRINQEFSEILMQLKKQ